MEKAQHTQAIAGILAPAYVVGEIVLDVDSLPGKRERLAEYGMPDIKELWGWGSCRRTERSAADLASLAAADAFARSGVAPSAIDAVVLCRSDPGNYYEQNRFLGELSERLGVGPVFMTWVSGAGCASLFSAIKIATAFVTAGTFENVLVLTVDRIADDATRLQRFGILSDGACALLVTPAGRADFAIQGVAVRSSPASLANGGEDFQSKCELIQSVFEQLQNEASFDFHAVSSLFSSNLHLPVQELETSALPLDGLVAYHGNIARYGHCYAADPVINLVDFYSDFSNSRVSHSIMASTAHGHFGMILLERRSGTWGGGQAAGR
jgi:3-oxoacyl-[acyl-carrier-protein] synthase-3